MEIIIGAAVSLLVQLIKSRFKTVGWETIGFVLLVSLAASAAYVSVVNTPFWPVIMQVFTVAGAFYAYILQRFE